MKDLQKLNDLFNVETCKISDVLDKKIAPNPELDQEEDYELARKTLRKVIIAGSDTLDDITNLAKNSEHPRAYEVTGQIMKTLSDVSKDLLGLQKQAKELKANENPANQIGTQNNVVFAGSTHELMKILGKKDDNSSTIDQ